MSNKRNAGEFLEKKQETLIRIKGKYSENGFETHTNIDKEESFALRTP